MKRGERVSRRCENWEMHQYMDMAVWEEWIAGPELSAGGAFAARVSDSPLSSLLWQHVVSVVSNKEEILAPSRPPHRGRRRIYGVYLLHRGCFWN